MADNPGKRGKNERNKVSNQPHELAYLKEKLGVSSQAIAGAKRATGSNDRKVVEDYLKNKNK